MAFRWMLAAALALAACGKNDGGGSVVPASFTLSVQKSGAGSGNVSGGGIDCGLTCSATIAAGTVVSLAASPDDGSRFDRWDGCDSSAGTTCTLAMNADRTVVATFGSVGGDGGGGGGGDGGVGECAIGATRQCSEDASGSPIAWPTGAPLGACRYGTQACAATAGASAWGACVGAVAPAARDCRSPLDNDCDGSPDNTRDQVCQCQPGDPDACTGNPAWPQSNCPGTRTCQIGKESSSWSDCNGPQFCACSAPQACTVGSCQGTQACTDGQLGSCESGGEVLPPNCQCLPGAAADCSALAGENSCGAATCSSAFDWDTSACFAPEHYCSDNDGDGHGDPNDAVDSCTPLEPDYVKACDDCAPGSVNAYPGGTCGIAGDWGNYSCGAGYYDSSCVCKDAACVHTVGPFACPGGTYVADTDPCPGGYTLTACLCTVGTTGAGCVATPNPDQSCHVVITCSGPSVGNTYGQSFCLFMGE